MQGQQGQQRGSRQVLDSQLLWSALCSARDLMLRPSALAPLVAPTLAPAPHTLPAGPEWGCCHSLVADAVAPARQVQCGNGVKEAGSQATQASVPQGWSHRARERGRNRQARVRNR